MAISADDLKRLSPKAKAGLMLAVFCLVGYFYYMFYLQDAWAKQESLETKLVQLKEEVKKKEKIAADREKHIADLETLQSDFQVALQKLPDKKEIPLLLESISLEGRNAGIDFLLFEPVPVISPVKRTEEDKKKAGGTSPPEEEKFYQDIPVRVRLVGSYADTLDFLGKVSQLPRIINVEDLVVGGQKDNKTGKSGMLITSCVLKTYMFLEQ